MFKGRTIVGLVEEVIINGSSKKMKVKARIDSGATKSSIDIELAENLNLGPAIQSKIVKSAHGRTIRPLVSADIIIAGRKVTSMLTLADRKDMKYKVLIGQDVLKQGFLIDPMKE